MGLQNAFGDIALDASLQTLIAKIVEQAVRQALNDPNKGLQYAKTISDQMRVVVDTAPATAISGINVWNNGTYATYYTAGALQSVDKRHQQAELANSNFLFVRQTRWVIS